MYARRCLAVLGLIGVSVAVVAQTVNLRPGKYEMTTEISMADMPKMPPFKAEQCITGEDVKNIAAGKKLGGVEELGLNCKTSNFKLNGKTVTFSVTCDSGTWNVETTFAGDAYTQVLNGKDSQGHVMTGKGNAKRIGDCTK